MSFKIPLCRLLILFAIVFYVFINVLFFWTNSLQTTCNCPATTHPTQSIVPCIALKPVNRTFTPRNPSNGTQNVTIPDNPDKWSGPHRLAVIVPFRDRWEELLQFAPHIHKFLNRQKVAHDIWVVNQVDSHRFNRAMLINVGFSIGRVNSDYFVMHDVDLLPLNDDLKYSYPSEGPMHLSSPELHPLYHYKKFVGGILMMTNNDFVKINGLTNIFWGWGREDDEFYLRMMEAELKLNRPEGITTGYNTFLHLHDKDKRPRDMKSIGTQRVLSRRRDHETGLNSLKYELVEIVNLTISGAPLRLVSVKLHCDYDKTPFCDHSS